jgi:phage terminase large subunit
MMNKSIKDRLRLSTGSTTGDKETDRRLVRLIKDPVKFSQQVLGHKVWRIQGEILTAVSQHSRVAVKACHGSSKTFAAAEAAVHWVTRHSDGIVVTTAPTFEQIKNITWREIHNALKGSRFTYPKANLTELRLSPTNYIVGWSTNEGIRFQGLHGHILFIVDEAPGVQAQIWEAIEGARAGGEVRILALGNPTIAGGPFYDAFTENRSSWKTITIDAFETPNLEGFTLEMLRNLPLNLAEDDPIFAFKPLPYLVTRRWVYEKFWEWGEQSPLWQSRVRGQFPEQSEDSLIALSWLESARCEPADTGERVVVGIDVAGPGKDETVVTVRCGGSILEQRFWADADPRGQVVNLLNRWKSRLEAVNVDSIGVGYNFGLHLRDLGFPVKLINVGESSHNPERFQNLKASLFWALRERFKAGEVKGLKDERTISQLALIRYYLNSRGQIVIESKEELLKRGVKSPDRADSVMLAFAVRHNARAFIDGTLLYLEQALLPNLHGELPASGREEDSLMGVYNRTVAETEERLLLMQARGLPTTPSPRAQLQVCPKCGQQPGIGDESMYNNGVPTWHRNCRPALS